ncbi:TonB-dependent receptor [Sphingomonas bacterium]|uniref:TonB-dependent receptor n=1 Tax=Sphingomonas bacterium TaxID=1895847 RepID=UPI0020C68D5D|nr:TonB-dependent receptor [Sphingomonas bacterium]
MMLLSTSALVAIAAPAAAQNVPTTADSTTTNVSPGQTAIESTTDAQLPGDVVVTAQRRSERLQDVPIAITAVSAADLSRLHVDNAARLEFITPGFTWGSQGSDSFPAIRGVRTSLVSAQNDPVIGFYIDGIYQSRTQQQSIPLFDVSRVEVQRGPQGTLYGRNTFGGNISVVTAAPEKEFGAGLNGDFGNFSEQRIDGYVNLPLSDTLQVRVAGVYQHHDGYVHSTTPGIYLNDLKENAERINLKWTPDSRLVVEVHASHWLRGDAGAGSYGYKVAGTLLNPVTGYQSINGLPYAVNPSVPNGSVNVGTQDAGVPVTGGAYTNDWNYQPFEHIRENYGSGSISYDLDFATVRSITGYNDFVANRSADNDQSSKTFSAYGYGSGVQEPLTHSRTFTQELQLASKSTTPFQWIIGGYYLHDNIFETYQQEILPASFNVPGFRGDIALHTNAYAGYAQASYFVVPDKLRLIGGIRYSHEKKAFLFSDYYSAAAGTAGTFNFTKPDSTTAGSPKFNSVTWRAGAEFTPSRTTMVYATASTGFESGGVNDNAALPSYAPQKVRAYEAGLKNQFMGGRITTDVSLFYNRYSNLQISVYTPQLSYFGSAGKARSYGAEFALRSQFYKGFHVDATAAYLNAKYTTYISSNNFYGLSGPANAPADPVSVNLAGKRIPQSPRLKTTLSVYYDADLGDNGTVTPLVTYLHSSSYFTTDFNTPLDYQHSYDKVDASLRWTDHSSKYFVEGYGENLGNTPVLFSAVIGRRERIQVSYGPPRVYGVRAGVKF